MTIRFIPAALIAVIVALVAVGGAALAFSFGTSDNERTDDLLDRAAADLGVEPQTLKDALTQARAEITTEQQQQLLADLVEAEVITQEQANEASIWLDQQPAALDKVMQPEILLRLAATNIGDVVMRDPVAPALQMFGSDLTEKMADILGIEPGDLTEALQNAREAQVDDDRADAVNKIIDQLVTDGDITSEEGDEIKAWLDEMPEWMTERGILFRIFTHGLNGFAEPFFLERGEGKFQFGEGFPPFFAHPEAHTFKIPGFEFRSFGDSDGRGGKPERRFFYHGPDGEFSFDGEVPPDFEFLFDQPWFDELEERFGHDFGDLDELLEQFPFRLQPAPGHPDESDDDVSAEKGA
jgi:polyhydroxyalkanoate synthesis regulator phasin